jgi:hypothetical protein
MAGCVEWAGLVMCGIFSKFGIQQESRLFEREYPISNREYPISKERHGQHRCRSEGCEWEKSDTLSILESHSFGYWIFPVEHWILKGG